MEIIEMLWFAGSIAILTESKDEIMAVLKDMETSLNPDTS